VSRFFKIIWLSNALVLSSISNIITFFIYLLLFLFAIFFIRERSQALDSNSTDKIGIGKAVNFFYFISWNSVTSENRPTLMLLDLTERCVNLAWVWRKSLHLPIPILSVEFESRAWLRSLIKKIVISYRDI
jgi:hypothetical protein